MDNSKDTILRKLNSEEFINYVSKLEFNTIILFGSINTEEFNEFSDVDIAVLSKEKVKLKKILEFEMFLENFLQRNIDVIDLKSENLDIFIKVEILNTGISIYTSDKNKLYNEFYNSVEIYYNENKHYFNIRRRDVLYE